MSTSTCDIYGILEYSECHGEIIYFYCDSLDGQKYIARCEKHFSYLDSVYKKSGYVVSRDEYEASINLYTLWDR